MYALDIERILAILVDSLGKVDQEENPLPGSEVIDVFLLRVTLDTDKVHEHEAEMIELLREWPDTSWGQYVPPLGKEINYLVAGGVLGDQRSAFLLFAFGKLLDWWNILDPSTVLKLEKDDPLAQALAGQGMIAVMGYRPQVAA